MKTEISETGSGFKQVLKGALIFSGLTTLATSYFAPKLIAWYFDPPVDIGVNCRSAVEWSMARLQTAQLAGAIFGVVLGGALVFWWGRRKQPSI